MSNLQLTKARIHAGRYEALLTADREVELPRLSASHLERQLDGLHLVAHPEAAQSWYVTLEIPADLLSDGVQTILLTEEGSSEILDSFTLIAGEPLGDDLRGEIDLLRAELDMLKRAFRRHCRETT